MVARHFATDASLLARTCRVCDHALLGLRFDIMAIGGIGAYLLFNDSFVVRKILFSRVAQVLALAGIAGTLFGPDGTLFGSGITYFFLLDGYLMNTIYALYFLVVVLNVAANPNSLIKLESGFTNFMGKISYGVYCYHRMVIEIVVQTGQRLGMPESSPLAAVLLHVSVLTATTCVAAFSYHYFEKPFLNRKHRFTSIVSGEGAAEAVEPSESGTPAILLFPADVRKVG